MRGKPRKCVVRKKARWYVDYDEAGKRRRKLFDTETEAKVFQATINQKPATITPLDPCVDSGVRLAMFAALWLDDRRVSRTLGTIRGYRDRLVQLLDFQIGGKAGTTTIGGISYPADAFGAVPVRELHAGHVEALVRGMARGSYSPGTIKLTLTLLGAVLERAVAKGLLAGNPITRSLRQDLAPFLTRKADETKHFTREQAQMFLAESARSSRLHLMFLTGFGCGLRVGELVGLQIPDVRDAKLHVMRQLDPTAPSHAPVATLPKGNKTRVVDLGHDLQIALHRVIAERPKDALKHGWGKSPWLFLTASGGVLRRQTVRDEFTRIMKRCGLDKTGLTVHGMRHTFTTLHVEAGADPKWLQAQLGHASISLTLDLYAKHAQLTAPGAADALATTLLGNNLGNSGQS
jgi:integrase